MDNDEIQKLLDQGFTYEEIVKMISSEDENNYHPKLNMSNNNRKHLKFIGIGVFIIILINHYMA